MKHIKKYNSINENNTEIKYTIDEILLDLENYGFDILSRWHGQGTMYMVNIKHKNLSMDENYRDTIIRLIDYMKGEGWNSRPYFQSRFSGNYKNYQFLVRGDIIQYQIGHTWNILGDSPWISQVVINFTK